MASNKGRRSTSKKPDRDEDPTEEEVDSGLMAEIDTNASPAKTDDPVMGMVGDDTPAAEEPPQNVPAYVPPASEKWGRLVSRANHPLEVQHQEGAIRVSPRQMVRVDGAKLIGTLPKGVNFVPDRR